MISISDAQSSRILEGTGEEIPDRFKKMGQQRVRIMVLPDLPKPTSFPVDESEAGMDAIGEGTKGIPVDKAIIYNRADIYFDHD